jgi:phosphoribosylformylglycinamidine (FGAM) synthase PurS component
VGPDFTPASNPLRSAPKNSGDFTGHSLLPAIADVRQSKFFEIALADGITREQPQKDVETIAHDVLANPVIEEYRVEIVD